jgi:hypothetical protein
MPGINQNTPFFAASISAHESRGLNSLTPETHQFQPVLPVSAVPVTPERFRREESDGVADSFARRGESEARAG